jgi:hypothetical protein
VKDLDPVWETRISECKEIFLKKMAEIQKVWPVDIVPWAKNNIPSLYAKVVKLDGEMGDVWLAYADGQCEFSSVTGVIDLWFHANMMIVREYNKACLGSR